MKNIYFVPLIILMFFSITVGAFNIVNNTNNRPYRLHEFIEDCSQINFDLTIVQDFIRDGTENVSGGDRSSINTFAHAGGPDPEHAVGGRFSESVWEKLWDDSKPFLENIGNFYKQVCISIASIFDFSINVVNVVRQVVTLLWNFCVGVPVEPV